MGSLYMLIENLVRRNFKVYAYAGRKSKKGGKKSKTAGLRTATVPDPDNLAIIKVMGGKTKNQGITKYKKGKLLSKDDYYRHINRMMVIIGNGLDELFEEFDLNRLLDRDKEKEKLAEAYTVSFVLGELCRQIVYTEIGIRGLTKSYFLTRFPSLRDKLQRQDSNASNKFVPSIVEFDDDGEIVDYGTLSDDSSFSDPQDPYQLQLLHSRDRSVALNKAENSLSESDTLRAPIQLAIIRNILKQIPRGNQSLLKNVSKSDSRTQKFHAVKRISKEIAKVYPVPPEITIEEKLSRIKPAVLREALSMMAKRQTSDASTSFRLITMILNGDDLASDHEIGKFKEGRLRRLKTKALNLLTSIIIKMGRSTATERKERSKGNQSLNAENERHSDIVHFTRAEGEPTIRINGDGSLSGCIVKRIIKIDRLQKRRNEMEMRRRGRHHKQIEHKKHRRRRARIVGRKCSR